MRLLDGPLVGTSVPDDIPGRFIVVPEYQRCNKELCHLHCISHEYVRDGHWMRSYSYLDSYL